MSCDVQRWLRTQGPRPDDLDAAGKPYGEDRARKYRMAMWPIADHADEGGAGAHPGLDQIAAAALVSKGTAARYLAALVADGWLVQTARAGGPRRAATYQLNLEWRAARVRAIPSGEARSQGARHSEPAEAREARSGPPRGAQADPVTRGNPVATPPATPSPTDVGRSSTSRSPVKASLEDGQTRLLDVPQDPQVLASRSAADLRRALHACAAEVVDRRAAAGRWTPGQTASLKTKGVLSSLDAAVKRGVDLRAAVAAAVDLPDGGLSWEAIVAQAATPENQARLILGDVQAERGPTCPTVDRRAVEAVARRIELPEADLRAILMHAPAFRDGSLDVELSRLGQGLNGYAGKPVSRYAVPAYQPSKARNEAGDRIRAERL